MKKTALLLAILFITVTAFAQKRSDLKGPQYKNYKPWQHDTKVEPVYTSNKKVALTGPAYKNYKPWKKTEEKNVDYQQVVSNNKRAKLTGPAYKNYKPWLNKKAALKEETTVIANENELDQ